MAKLTNQLTWSVSRDRLFRSCRRAYYYHYYGAWGGWESDASPQTRQLYILKNMTTLEMWAGSIVHDVIAEALRRYARTSNAIRTGELQARAREKLRNGWREAVGGAWKRSPKKTNLFRLYYGNGKSLPADETERTKERVYGCLEAFAQSEVLKEIASVSYLNWQPVDTLNSFQMDGVKVWAAVDFAYQDAAGKTRIIDWKTGHEDEDAVRLQLACYAYYAAEAWHVPFEQQRQMGVFLGDGARVSEYNIDSAALVDARDAVLSGVVDMREVLRDVDGNVAAEEDFPPTEKDWPCRRCSFREVCPKIASQS